MYVRKYKNGKPCGIATEILFDTIEEVVEYIRTEYVFSGCEEYHVEDTYGNCLAIVRMKQEDNDETAE